MRRRGPTGAELALWQLVTRDVRPLRSSVRPQPIPEPAPPVEPIAAVSVTASPGPERRPPVRPGAVDRATLDRLRAGKITIEARIDLHGMTQTEAFAALMGFIESAHRAGRRALLVITGKGPTHDGGGVLRRNVPHWLMASTFSARILTVIPANARHGGDGAFYVVLRRDRAKR